MAGIRRRSLALATLLVFVISGVALAAPSFSDQNIDAGNLNPTDRIKVQEIQVTRGTGTRVVIGSVTIYNRGTAPGGAIAKIEIEDGATTWHTTNTGALKTGITIPIGYELPGNRTLNVWVTVGTKTSVTDGQTLRLEEIFHYQVDGSTGDSPLVSDRSGETIREGGFDQLEDNSPDAGYFNPTDQDEVQIAVFTDNDANGNDVTWIQTGSNTILEVENLGTGTTNDIDKVKVTLDIENTDYTTGWINWVSTSPMAFAWDDFDDPLADGTQRPPNIPDNDSVTVTVEMQMDTKDHVTDGRTIRTRVTLYVSEGGQDYVQRVTSGTTQTIRKQGFESTTEESTLVTSGTVTSGEYLEQTITVTDDDVNDDDVRATQIHVQNLGTADGNELHAIEVKSGTTQLAYEDDAADLADFRTGLIIDLVDGAANLAEDGADPTELTLKLYYHVNDPVDGHTLQPRVKVKGQEPDGGANEYWSDKVTYPNIVNLYDAGLEIVENATPPEGGTAYSAERLLAQKIRVEDLDQNTSDVFIHPVVVRNLGTAQENPDVVKLEVVRIDGDDELPMGESADLDGFRTPGGGVTISTRANNKVNDEPSGAVAFLGIYVTIADPEAIVEGRTIQLETRVLHTEGSVAFDKTAVGNLWTLAINHRPTCDFDYTPSTNLTYEREITFTAKNVSDADDDDIVAHRWEFSDGGSGTGTSVKHTFAGGGTVWAKLTVEDEKGLAGSKTKSLDVEPPPVVPAAQFTWAPQAPATGEEVTFTDTSTTPAGTTITDRSWDLDGDGTEDSDAENPTHTYTTPGTYEVSLTVTNSDAQTDTVTHEVEVPAAKPTANFDYSPTTPDVGDPVTFTDKSSAVDPATIETWAWDFGDDSTSTDQNSTHAYTAMGTYTASLTVTDSNEETSNAHTEEIVVGPATMVYSYPNPASDAATIVYRLPEGATDPVLRIFDLVGRLVRQEDLDPAQTTYSWDLTSDGGAALPNGLYFCRITVKDATGKTRNSQIFKLLIDQ